MEYHVKAKVLYLTLTHYLCQKQWIEEGPESPQNVCVMSVNVQVLFSVAKFIQKNPWKTVNPQTSCGVRRGVPDIQLAG